MQDSGFDQQHLKPERVEISPSFEIQTKTVANNNHPECNEDAMFSLPEKRAAGVFDGIGGYSSGDKASQIAKKETIKSLQTLLTKTSSFHQVREAVRQTLASANLAVFRQADIEGNNMGTTASLVCVWEGQNQEKKIVVGNVGDSRVYLLRNRRLEQITLDDNLISLKTPNEQEARQLQAKLNNATDPKSQLTKKEQRLFRQRNLITQKLGQETIEPRIYTLNFFPGDKLIICSDGVSDNLTDREIQKILNRKQNSAEAVKEIIEASQVRSRSNHPRAKADDITVIIINESQTKRADQLRRDQLKKGMSVRVQRSSGAIESGWFVKKFNPTNGTVIVLKSLKNNRYLKKEVPQERIVRLNRSATTQDIPRAENLTQLFDILRQIGGIRGTKNKLYSYPELQEIIRDVLERKAPIRAITRSGGLRNKVAELLTKGEK